jgi:hypothetical protein
MLDLAVSEQLAQGFVADVSHALSVISLVVWISTAPPISPENAVPWKCSTNCSATARPSGSCGCQTTNISRIGGIIAHTGSAA